MKITSKSISVREIINGYSDESEFGGSIVGYGGKLNIRPEYQREFVYKKERQIAVIETILDGCPLNNMYWAKSEDGTYELVDGQQRTTSVCLFVVENAFSVNVDGKTKYFHSFSKEDQEKILNYEFEVKIIEGTNDEKLKWFHKINIAGMELTTQELRNSVYTGQWLFEAKKFFSKSNCPAKKITNSYWGLKEGWNRQKALEHALSYVADRDGCTIEDYMSKHQYDDNADDLINFFKTVMEWVKKVFPFTYKEMLNINEYTWYNLYKKHHMKTFDVNDINDINDEIRKLLDDDDVDKKTGIWEYVLDHNEYHLHIRNFSESIKNKVYRKQGGKCAICGKSLPIEKMQADHIIPWSKGGSTIEENCQMLCKSCNCSKGVK